MDYSTSVNGETEARGMGDRLASETAAHRQALAAFIETAESLAPGDWNATRPEEKWSPAQVAEHLRLTYATLLRELSGREGFRIRTSGWQRWLLRLRHLRPILQQGRFPRAVPATREIRPAPGPYDRNQLLLSLRQESDSFLIAIEAAPREAVLTHAFVGQLPLLDGLRFTTQHIRHHHKQILPARQRPDA